jgi:hypothetical protein
LPQRDSERAQILDAIHERLGVAPLITIIEGAAVNLDGVLDDVPRDTTADTRRLDLRSRAALASRRIAGELTREAIHLGELEVALANADTPTAASMSLDNAMEWEEARSAVIAVATDMVTAWDTSIEASVDHALAARVREVLQEPDVDQLRAQVDAWREDTSHRFRRRAKIWFRKRTGDALLDHWSWLAATNPDEPLPRRVRRMMGDALESTVRKSRADLVAIADGPVVQRLGAWQDVVNQAGGYRPGVLKAAADALDPGGPVDG